jgi:poly(hydroxyalkanoate) granule-associated protein
VPLIRIQFATHKEITMARTTKRTTRTSRSKPVAKPVAALNALRTNAAGAFDTLIKRGNALQQKGRKLAVAKTQEAREAVFARADEARTKTMDAVSQLEKVFENRVTRVISKLGVPTARDVRALSRQVAVLQQSVDQLRRSRARA